MKRLCIILLIGCLLSISPVVAQGPHDLPPDVITSLQALIDSTVADPAVPGLVLWLDTPQGTFAGAGGLADLEAGTPMQPDDALRIGSITKMFTATIVLQLMEEGALSLDDPLGRWLPNVAERLPEGDRITLRQLLNHTSGIYNYREDAYFRHMAALPAAAQNLDRVWEPRELIDMALFHDPYFSPGAPGRWHYSNTNYTLLCMIIEAAGGTSVTEAYHRRIFEPLGLRHTYLADFEPPIIPPVHGYTLQHGDLFDVTRWNATESWCGGGLVSTAPDVITFAHALFSGALFSDAATLAEMLDFVEPIGGMAYGLGVAREGRGIVGHFGNVPGFAAQLMAVPRSDRVAIYIANTDSPPPALWAQLADAVRALLNE